MYLIVHVDQVQPAGPKLLFFHHKHRLQFSYCRTECNELVLHVPQGHASSCRTVCPKVCQMYLISIQIYRVRYEVHSPYRII